MSKKGPGWFKDRRRHQDAAKRGWNTRLKGMSPSHTPDQLRAAHAKRPQRARAQDEKRTAKRLLEQDSPFVGAWMKNPGQMDIMGIDGEGTWPKKKDHITSVREEIEIIHDLDALKILGESILEDEDLSDYQKTFLKGELQKRTKALEREGRKERRKITGSKEYRDAWKDRVPDGLQNGDTINFINGETLHEMEGQVINYRQDGRVIDIRTADGETYTLKATNGTFKKVKGRVDEKISWWKKPNARYEGEPLTGDILSSEGGRKYQVQHLNDNIAGSWKWKVKNMDTGETLELSTDQVERLKIEKRGSYGKEMLSAMGEVKKANNLDKLEKYEGWMKRMEYWEDAGYAKLRWELEQRRRVLNDKGRKKNDEYLHKKKQEEKKRHAKERETSEWQRYSKYLPHLKSASKDLSDIEKDLRTKRHTSIKGFNQYLDRLEKVAVKLRKDTPLGADRDFNLWTDIDENMGWTLSKITHKKRTFKAEQKAKKGIRGGKNYLDERAEVYEGNTISMKKGLALKGWPRFGEPDQKPMISTDRAAMIVKRGVSPSFDKEMDSAIKHQKTKVIAVQPIKDQAVRIIYSDRDDYDGNQEVYLSPTWYYEAKAIAGPGARFIPTGPDRPIFISGKNGVVLLAPRITDEDAQEAAKHYDYDTNY